MLDFLSQLFNQIIDIFTKIVNLVISFVPQIKPTLLWLWGIAESIAHWLTYNFGDNLTSIAKILAKIIVSVIDFLVNFIKGVVD